MSLIDNRIVQPVKRPLQGLRCGRESGQSLVEMVLITPLLLLMFLGVLEVGWALRGYLVLVNASREGARFAARGRYLDFSQPTYDSIGYPLVLDHISDTIASQLAVDFTSPHSNAAVIMSHYFVDTGDSSVLTDDLVLTPREVPTYWVRYGKPIASSVDIDELTAQLIAENIQFNTLLKQRDPAAPPSVNSVIIVELYYEQRQLLGVPIISNRFTDPVPLYTYTMMRIASDARASGTE
jgi:hypothetical protein